MLEAVVEEVNDGLVILLGDWLRILLGQQPGVVALRGDVDRNAGHARNQQRLVAEVLSDPVLVDAVNPLTLAAVASAEHIHANTALEQSPGQRDGQRRLARASGGEIADADDGIAQPPRRRRKEPEFTNSERQPVERNQRQKQAARREEQLPSQELSLRG